MSLLASVSLPTSPYPPLAVGFFGLGTGYLIYGPQELFGFPKRDESVDYASGVWGLWMPGFMQFLAGTYLFLGLTLFGTFTAKPLYMAALAFTAFGVHWFALGWNRIRRTESEAERRDERRLPAASRSSASSCSSGPRIRPWQACSSASPACT